MFTPQTTQVILPPVNGEIYNSGEPQRITLRQPNSATITLDTFDSLGERSSPTHSLSSQGATQAQFQFSGNRLVIGGIKRFAAADMNILWSGVNVNPVNNVVRFSYSVSSFEAEVPEGSYDTPKKLMDALANAMNTAVGSSIFSWTDDPIKPGFGTLQSSLGLFSFLDCPAVEYGKHLWNLPLTPPATSLVIGQVSLIYTRWIDVISQELTQYVKLNNTSTSSSSYPSPGNLLARFQINFPPYENGYKELSRRIQSFQNFQSSNDLQSLDLSFRDEWGKPLFLYDNNDIVIDIYAEC